jgi:DNA-binding MarR family transcriptional regulator
MDADGSGGDDPAQVAAEFARLFQDTYLRFHRRDGRRSELSGASRAVLLHLAMAGPLTVGEAALHLDRAQSVVSEIVSQLERHGLLERERDPADRRRVLVWLTAAGRERLARDAEVLSGELLERAIALLPASDRRSLVEGLRALVAAGVDTANTRTPMQGKESRDDHRAGVL